MRIVLAVLAFVLLAPDVHAGAVWTGKTVPVYDYTSPAWEGIIAATVADMNAMLPKKAPRLVYRRMPERPCSQAPERQGVIVVCLLDATDPSQAHAVWLTQRHIITEAQIRLSPSTLPRNQRKEACHEFMHATTGISDNYGASPETSCVWGTLSNPGPIDVAFARKVYRKHGERRER